MPTNEERRVIARRLRRLAEKYDGVVSLIVERNLGLISDDRFIAGSVFTSDSVKDLADLIEPEPEITCEWVWGEDWIESSPTGPREPQWANWYLNCGCWDGPEREFEDFDDPHEKPSNDWGYCPRCGAKVVQNGER